jgi:Ca-activated chloride channel family protein
MPHNCTSLLPVVAIPAAATLCMLAWPPTGARAQFASGVTLVEVYVTVSGAGGPVANLEASDFEVFEDGVPQEVTAFARGEFPLSVAIAIDRSWSMAGQRLTLAKRAARAFLEQLRPGDRSMLIAVASDTEVMAPLSTGRSTALDALARLQPWSTSGLYDALIACIDLIQPATGRRALVLLSDGVDRYSRAAPSVALAHARGRDVLVYPVAFGTVRPPLFAELASETGGQSFLLRDPKDVQQTFATIADELRHQYLLGYTPSRPIDSARPAWRSIQVKVNRAGLRVRARDGYLAK